MCPATKKGMKKKKNAQKKGGKKIITCIKDDLLAKNKKSASEYKKYMNEKQCPITGISIKS